MRLFLCVAMVTAITLLTRAASWSTPAAPACELSDEEVYYLYLPSENKFLSFVGNNAVMSNDGSAITFHAQSNGEWRMQMDHAGFIYADFDKVGTDGESDEPNSLWYFEKQQNSTWVFRPSKNDADFGWNSYPNQWAGIQAAGNKGLVAVTNSAAANYQWLIVAEKDYPLFNSRVILSRRMSEAQSYGADFSNALSVYNSASSNKAAIDAAIAKLENDIFPNRMEHATDDNPVDVTFRYLKNPDFTEGWQDGGKTIPGWTSVPDNSFCLGSWDAEVGYADHKCISMWTAGAFSDRTLSQKLTEIPSGYYKFTMHTLNARHTGEDGDPETGNSIFAKSGTAYEENHMITWGWELYPVSLTIEVRNGELEIGAKYENTNVGHFFLDDVQLLYLGKVTPSAKLNKLSADAQNIIDAEGINQTYSDNLQAFISRWRTLSDQATASDTELEQMANSMADAIDEAKKNLSLYKQFAAKMNEASALLASSNESTDEIDELSDNILMNELGDVLSTRSLTNDELEKTIETLSSTLNTANNSLIAEGSDVSYLLKNSKFDKSGGWKILVGEANFDTKNQLVEKWWGDFQIEQVLENIPNGTYRLEVQGFHWHCWDWSQGEQWWKNGQDLVSAEVYLNNDAVKVQNLYGVGPTDIKQGYNATSLGYYVPNDANSAHAFFEKGLFENVVETKVTDHTLKVGISMIEMAFWSAFTNARLTFVEKGSNEEKPEDEPAGTCNRTAAEIAACMGIGWNLGNTLEGGGSDNVFTNKGGLSAETAWQDTKTTQEVIDFVKSQGFKSVRIPCAWVMGHISDPATYKIDEKWMARVKEIVDYCIKDDLYVVLNDHWDGGWLENNIKENDPAKKAKNKEVLAAIWTQIANEFRNYDDHLLFAGLNEPNAEDQAATNNLIEYEQVFIDAVRATGGNNEKRVLVVQGPSTNILHTCNYFKMPSDPTASNRLMVEVHYYSPWQFWGMEKDESWGRVFYYWGKDNHVAGSKHNPDWDCEEADMERQLKQMYDKFVKKGVPVLIGELGANWRDISGLAGESQEKHDASIKLYYKLVCKLALELGMVPMPWDTNYRSPSMTILNRKDLTVYNSIIMDAITEANATDIKSIESAAPAAAGKAYDLQGRSINPDMMQHGVYIMNGKKYVK